MRAERAQRLRDKRASLRAVAKGFRRGFGDSVSPVGLGQAAGAGIALFGAAQAVEVTQKAYHALKKKRDFNQMLETNPELEDTRREMPEHFVRMYNSLRSLNPQFASDPIVAGNYMRNMSRDTGNAGMMIVDSLRSAPNTRLSPFVESFRRGQKGEHDDAGKEAMDARIRAEERVSEFRELYFPSDR